ncbi:MAG: GIY-YIG nuclease family protein [Anaerolineales bacterium]|jgi:putative endonuclease
MESICCYILLCSDGTLYTGWTTNIQRRLQDHNAGRGGRYTRSRRPVELIYLEPQVDARAARLREVSLKKLKRSEKLKLADQAQGGRTQPAPPSFP